MKQFTGSSDDFIQDYRTILLSSPEDHLTRLVLSLALLRSREYTEACEQARMVLPDERSTSVDPSTINKDIAFGEVRSATARLIMQLKVEMQASSDEVVMGAVVEQFNVILLELDKRTYGN